jgi:endonuclease/exonuclease/phosphatase family metal-dependent hydrolase
MIRTLRIALFGAALLAFSGSLLQATESLRVATYNIEAINFSTTGYTSLVNVLKRMDADVVCLQEITTSTEVPQVATLAAAAGYPYSTVSLAQGTLTGNLRNAILSRYPLTNIVSWGADDISPDPNANDITRDILQAEVIVPEVCQNVGIFTVHLKSGSTSLDKFRRAVELRRVKMVIESWATAHPGAPLFFCGDLNDDVADAPFGNTFTSLPSGLPATYDLGSDITFPVVYDPFVTISQFGGLQLVMADATSEDCTNCYLTRSSSGRRLDYIYTRLSTVVLGDEVYASPSDNNVDDGAQGNWLYKAFTPPGSGASSSASDHYSVYADYLLNSCDGSRYGTGYPGHHALIPRAGIKGIAKPGAANFGARLVYGKPSSPAVLVLGKLKLNPPFGLSTAPFVPGGTLYVDVVTAYGIFPTATDSKGDSNFGLPLPNSPTVLGLVFESQWFVSDALGPNGVGALSDAYSVTVHN